MKRQIVYPGQVPLETDILNTNKNILIAIGHVLQDMIGTSTLFSGLGCVPTAPAGMTVNVNPGRAYSLQVVDAGAYSSLVADSHQIVKQGILLDAANFSCPAPTTAGYSINYLVQGAFQEVDGGSTVLPFYNATNPSQAYSGPNGTGASSTTYRDNTVQLSLKAGVAATTGSQVTPTPDAGFNGLWVITVPYGATTITSANIAQYVGAPFLTRSLLQGLQAQTGQLLRVSSYSGGVFTWNQGAGTVAIRIRVQAPGGSGGGAPATGSGQVAIGSGGSAGSYGEGFFTTFPSSFTVTAPVGPSGTVGAVGTNASAASAGSLISAPGGLGGSKAGPSAPPFAPTGAGVPGPSTGGNILNTVGNGGGVALPISTGVIGPALGGSSVLGGGGVASTGGAGQPATGYGGGGGGTWLAPSSAAVAGGKGGDAIVIIEEFGSL